MNYKQKIIAALLEKAQEFISKLPLTSVHENGILFKTGIPVTFNYLRNTQSSRQYKIPKHLYQQNLEPFEEYLLYDENPDEKALEGWKKGKITFNNPLVLNWSESGLYDETSWKFQLSNTFNKKGKSLTAKLKSLGFDAIVTVNSNHTSEMIKL